LAWRLRANKESVGGKAMSGDDILNFVFAGFILLLLAMIFVNVLGGPRRGRRQRRPSRRWRPADDNSGGVDTGPLMQPTGQGRRWGRGRDADDNGPDGGSDGGSDGGGGDGGGGD
jgi:uncharacterized membrane protein YgcG